MFQSDRIREVLNRAARHVFWQVLGAGIVFYFVYHAINGDRGFVALSRLQGEIQEARGVLDQVQDQRMQMEQRAWLLRPENLDPDMLDERARAVLDFSNPDDLIIRK